MRSHWQFEAQTKLGAVTFPQSFVEKWVFNISARTRKRRKTSGWSLNMKEK